MLKFIISCIISTSLFNISYSPEPVEIVQNIPILMYHEIGEPEGPWENLYVSKTNFIKQMEFLRNNNFTTITMKDLSENRKGKKILPKNPVIITFDDGYSSMYDFVFPTMREKDMVGTFYVYPKKFGTWNSLTEDQIKEMSDHNMEFGSHSMSHFDMGNMEKTQIKYEIEESKKILEEITGKEIESFCYPAGKYSTSVIEELNNTGYKSAVTTKYGFYSFTESPYEIKRIRINYSDSLDVFVSRITN